LNFYIILFSELTFIVLLYYLYYLRRPAQQTFEIYHSNLPCPHKNPFSLHSKKSLSKSEREILAQSKITSFKKSKDKVSKNQESQVNKTKLSVKKLIEKLKSSNPIEKNQAAEELLNIGTDEAISAVLEYHTGKIDSFGLELEYSCFPDYRHDLINYSSIFSDTHIDVPPLKALSIPESRIKGILNLQRGHIIELIKILRKKDNDEESRIAAGIRLKNLGGTLARKCFKELLDESSAALVYCALSYYAENPEHISEIIETILKHVESENKFVRASVAYLLRYSESQDATLGLLKLTDDTDEEVVNFACASIAYQAPEYLSKVAKKIITSSKISQIKNLLKLLKHARKCYYPELISKLIKHSDFEVSSLAIDVLMYSNDPDYINIVTNELLKKESTSRNFAIHNTENSKQNVQSTKSEDNLVSFPDFIEKIKRNPKKAFECNFLISVPSHINDTDKVATYLLEQYSSSSEYIREQLAATLGDIKGEVAFKGLIKMLEDNSVDVQYAALIALANIKDPRAERYVKKFLSSSFNPILQEAAAKVIYELKNAKKSTSVDIKKENLKKIKNM